MSWTSILARIVKHRWLDASDSERILSTKGLALLQAQVAASEGCHSGEIRICVEAGLPLSYLWREASARERAIAMFGKLRVWDTEQNNGVLIYLLLAEHRVEVVADRGLSRHVPAEEWEALASGMTASFKAGHFVRGLETAVNKVHRLLVEHFPLARDQLNPNELPDVVVLL